MLPIAPPVLRRSLFGLPALVALLGLALLAPPEAPALDAAYVHIVKNETPDTRFHLGELEAFAAGVTPNNSGGATFGGMNTSTNDIGSGTLTTYGNGNIYPTIGTTSALEHGGANRDPDNALQNGGAVWSTANNIGSNAQYTLDLGGTHDVTTLRMWPRADGCCSNRWRNLEIQLLDSSRNPIPGSQKTATNPGGNVPLEFTFPDQGGIVSFGVSPSTITSNTQVTFDWEIDPAATAATITPISGDLGATVGNVLPDTNGSGVGSRLLNPGPGSTTTFQLSATVGGQVFTEDVIVTVDNSPMISSFTATHVTVSPGTNVTLDWVASNFDTLTLNGAAIPMGSTSTVVAPLATTTYTLEATNVHGSTSADLIITVVNVPDTLPANGRFIEVVKNSTSNTMLHISEIEVFQIGTNPDEAHGDGTSSNDLVQSPSVSPSTETPPTTTSLAHGSPASVYDGNIESGAAVWTTANGLGVQPRYMLDLGVTAAIDKIRVFGRGDTCCTDRLQNFTVNVYEDNGSGAPGALVSSETFPGTAPAGNVDPVELSLGIPDPGIHSFTVDKPFIPQGEPITFSWEVSPAVTALTIDDGAGGVIDVLGDTDPSGTGSRLVTPGPNVNTTYTLLAVRPTGNSAAAVEVQVTDQPLIYSFTGAAGIVAPGTPVALSWDVANATSLTLNGSPVTGTGTTVTPTSTTTYTLVATNSNGSTDAEVRIRVVLPGEPLITEFMADNESGLADEDGDFSDWIELENATASAANLDGYYLTDDPANLSKWQFPAVTLNSGQFLVVFASSKNRAVAGSELHTNFNLSASGEYLALVKPDGSTIVTEFSPTYPSQHPDVSYGFDPVALQEGYFLTPTPGAANSSSFSDFVGDTAFSVDRGIYDTPISVAITTPTSGAEIRYTTDGSKPTATTGMVYTAPINISQTTVLRAAAFKPGYVPTNVDTHTYIFTADVIAHPNMSTGITQDPTYGPQMDASLKAVPTVSLVFQGDVERTEKEASVEFINFAAGDTQADAGMQRFGNYVTNFAKRSMRITFRNIYGPGKLDFPIFDGHDYPIPPADEVDAFDLRSGNHDMVSRGAYMSNRFTDDTMLDMGNIAPHGRFVHVYLNGLYWGQYHMRERWNAAMLAEYFPGEEEDYEAINANNSGNQFQQGTVHDGTGQYWNETITRVAGPNPYQNTRTHMDLPNVFDFMMLWNSGNSESEFRSAGSVPMGVPFKFFMKDADGFLRNPGSRNLNHNGPLNVMTELRNEDHPDYKILIADQIHKHYFNDGAFTPAKNIARLQERVNEIQTSFISESARWGYRSPSSWQSYQDNLINNHFPTLTAGRISSFQSTGHYPSLAAPAFNQHGGTVPPGFQLDITAPAGMIYYTTDGTDPRVAVLDGGTGNGSIAATAVLHNGSMLPINSTTEVRARTFDGTNWSALNEATFVQDFSALVVSEFMYNPSSPTPAEIAAGHNDSEDFEYLELLNTGAGPLDLTGLQFVDGITFDLGSGTITSLAAGARLLIVEDTAAFAFRYGAGHPVTGQYTGKLKDEGESVELVDPIGQTLHLFTYDNMAPWPTAAAGNGASLVLVNPSSLPDHDVAANWTASTVDGGTPGGDAVPAQTYAAFAATYGVGAEGEDPEGDGLANFSEMVLLGHPLQLSPDIYPVLGVVNLPHGGGTADFLTVTFTHDLSVAGVDVSAQVSTDLTTWNSGAGFTVLHSRTYHGDGTATSVFRSENPVVAGVRQFIRAHFTDGGP